MPKDNNSERMKLLFVADTESVQNKGRGEALSEGSASILKKWPHHVLVTVGTFIFLATIVIFIVFVIFILFVAKSGKATENGQPTNISNTTINDDATIPGSDFCKSITAENLTLLALGYVEGKKDLYSIGNSKDKIYYVIDQPISDQEACTIEAALRLLQEKSFYIIEMDGNKWDNSSTINFTDYILLLREHYPNLNKIKAEILTVFEGTPFEDTFKECDDLTIFATKVLLVWQYGGTSLSTNVVFTSRRVFDKNEGMCEVDRELLFCPEQCSAYVYQLIKTVLNVHKNNQTITNKDREFFFQKIVDKSVNDYCGNLKLAPTGCIGVNRIKNESICNYITRDCDFMRMVEWKRKTVDWKENIERLCPNIFKSVFISRRR